VLVAALGRRLVPTPARLSLPQVASVVAAMVGTAMLIERVVPLTRVL
jgi:hypothetical protein